MALDQQTQQALQGLQQQVDLLRDRYQLHDHNGVNSQSVSQSDLATPNVPLGQYLQTQVLTQASWPSNTTLPARDGATVIVNNAGAYRLYCHVNGDWHYSALT
jgi:hypothetical protein